MTRRREVGIIKSIVLGAAAVVCLALPAQAGDNKLGFSGFANVTTDYMFRSYSASAQKPAAQVEFDATYGIFYAGLWGSNTSYGDGIEIDYYAGITPMWAGITFDIAALYYTYPGEDALDYLEVKTAAKYSFGNLTLSIGNWWSPNNFGADTQSDAIEGGASYAFAGKLFNFFSPSISGALGYQAFEKPNILPEYLYWNAGLTLGFLDRWSADVRYYDADINKADCFVLAGGVDRCDARVVGSLKATF